MAYSLLNLFTFILFKPSDMRKEFTESLYKHQAAFGISLAPSQAELLADYYDLVNEHNSVLHLVGPASPEEFAVRHILESLALLEFLPPGSKIADVGSGAGLPAIPCLLVRDHLEGVLIESKLKKAAFLEEAIEKFSLGARAEVLGRQFEELERPAVSLVTCRALDKFSKKLPKLLRWSKNADMVLFGGPNLESELTKLKVGFTRRLIPHSEQRFIFIIRN